jgi:hypothetical protein
MTAKGGILIRGAQGLALAGVGGIPWGDVLVASMPAAWHSFSSSHL